jgi:hypothetical protein
MKTKLLLFTMLLLTGSVFSQKNLEVMEDFKNQSVISPASSSFETTAGSISWTLGDTVMTLEIIDDDLIASEMDFSIKTFPNPVDEKLNISHNSEENETLTVAIHDLFGRELINKQLLYKKNEINVRKLPSALYVVIIRNAKGKMVKSFKLIKH